MKLTCTLLTALLLTPLTALHAADATKPNIVYFLIDDMGYADVGFNGCRDIQTPNLDKFAQQGAVLDCLYGQPVCSPMRACLMTGRYPTRTGVYNILEYKKPAPWPLPLNERALTQTLQAAGGTQLSNWDKYRVPAKARHGCMLPVSRVQYTSLIQTFGRKNGEGR